jgi:hypothetical protein
MADRAAIFTRPLDRSLEAYKAWMTKIVAFLAGQDEMTDAQWEVAWREFWSDANEAEEQGQPAWLAGRNRRQAGEDWPCPIRGALRPRAVFHTLGQPPADHWPSAAGTCSTWQRTYRAAGLPAIPGPARPGWAGTWRSRVTL